MAFIKYLKSKLLDGAERSVKAKKNILNLLLLKGLSIGISLLMIPVSLNLLDEYKYGVWITLFNLISWIQIFDIGMGNGLRNKFTLAITRNNIREAKEYVSTAYVLMGCITIFLILLFLIPWLLLDWAIVFNLDSTVSKDVFLLVGITFALTAVQFTAKLITTLLLANHKPASSAFLFTISNILILLLFVILKKDIHGSLFMVGLVYTGIPLLVLTVASLIFFKGKYNNVKPSLSYFKKDKIKHLFGLGIQFFIIQIAVIVIFQTDTLIISHTLSPKEVTPYNIVFRYFGVVTMIASLVMTPFWSAFTEANEKNDFIWIRKIISFKIKFLVGLVFIVFILFLLAEPLIPLWLGREIEITQLLLIGMAVYVIIAVWNNIFSFFLNGISRTKVQVRTSIFAAFINIPLSIFLANKFGSAGVIFATIVSLSCFALFGSLETFKYIRENE